MCYRIHLDRLCVVINSLQSGMMERRCLPTIVVCLAMLLLLAGPAAGHRHRRKTKLHRRGGSSRRIIQAEPKSCSSKKGSSSLAVSVVFAQCQGDVVLAAERCGPVGSNL